jgi:membrane carboxypeptidase/penicillin-binding protein
MDILLAKIFATALAFSQVATAPDAVKTQFDPAADREEVVSLLRAGCGQMRKAFDIEDINLDDLIATAMDDPEAVAGSHAAFRGIRIADLTVAYRQFCKNETVADSPFDMAEVIAFYNRTMADLPDHTRLKGKKLPGTSVVLDAKGKEFAEIYDQDQRRVWVALDKIPLHVQQAFVAAEDKRFYQHHGIDERALIRAFIGNLAQSGRPQGGSTITQQVIKNLLVGEDVTYERKMREMVLASRLESTLSKSEILELYLNSVSLGRGSAGVEMASRSYLGKSVSALTLGEGALLAALTKGPSYFSPDRHPDRAKDRVAYVLSRMQEDGYVKADEARRLTPLPRLVAYQRARRDTGFHFVDHLAREAKTIPGFAGLTSSSYTVRSTIRPDLQRSTEAALQEGLARYESNGGRAVFQGPETNLADAVAAIAREQKSGGPSSGAAAAPAWRQALENARLPLYDVHWPAAIVIDKSGKGGDNVRVGLADGRTLPLSAPKGANLRTLKLYDVVFVRVVEVKGKGTRAELRVRPTVQGAAVVLENKSGRILAMAGGFSYPLSQLNRVTQAQRQPGSALKPLTYLAALQKGLQPNTLVRDETITLAPINGSLRDQDYWRPKNYEGGTMGVITLRRALENSRNLATANLLDGGVDSSPERSLDRICGLALELQIYKDCVRYYPFVLGAQPVRPIDLAAFFAAIANEGERPAPYAIESIEQQGAPVYTHTPSLTETGSADRASFYQLKSMLQGVVRRGTANAIASLSPYVAGKTGTSDGENDVWFVGFTNEVTVAVWIGYDNADGKRRTLGSGVTGGSLAVPIFESIIQAVWTQFTPRTLLSPPSPQASRLLVATRIGTGAESGDDANPNAKGSVEYLRRDGNGGPRDERYALVSPEEVYSPRYDDGYNSQQGFQPWGFPWGDTYRAAPRPPASQGGMFGFIFPRREAPAQFQPWQQPQQYQRYPQNQYQRQQPQPYQYQQRRPGYPFYQDR